MRTVVIGNGLIGAAVAARLHSPADPVWTVARSTVPDGGPQAPHHLRHDLATHDGRQALAGDLRRLGADRVVLTHGPSDVTWMEQHEQQATEVHRGVARVAAGTGAEVLLISTDNVFAGDRGGMCPEDPPAPLNAYGRAKVEAERAVLAGDGRVVRVSLVYGHAIPPLRATYAQRCLAAAAVGERLDAPTDQSFTPIHLDDVTAAVVALARNPAAPGTVLHLSGPQELSRHAFARLAYATAGADPDLVRPCLRGDTMWASRPRYSSLACSDFGALVPGWRAAAPADGLGRLLGNGVSR